MQVTPPAGGLRQNSDVQQIFTTPVDTNQFPPPGGMPPGLLYGNGMPASYPPWPAGMPAHWQHAQPWALPNMTADQRQMAYQRHASSQIPSANIEQRHMPDGAASSHHSQFATSNARYDSSSSGMNPASSPIIAGDVRNPPLVPSGAAAEPSSHQQDVQSVHCGSSDGSERSMNSGRPNLGFFHPRQ